VQKIKAGFISNTGISITSIAYSFGADYSTSQNLGIGVYCDGYDKNGTTGFGNL